MFSEIIIFIIVILIVLVYIAWKIRMKKLWYKKSKKLGLVEVFQRSNGEKVLTINKYPHGISTEKANINKSYWFFISESIYEHLKNTKKSHVLFLGLGANTSSYLVSQKMNVKQTIVEFDKIIIEACRIFFNLDKTKIDTLLYENAYTFVNKPNKKYINYFNAIVVDIFTGIPPFVSTKTNKPNFIENLIPLCKKNCIVIFNRPANIKSDREDTKKLIIYLKTQFEIVECTYIHDPRGYKNEIITAKILITFKYVYSINK